jgi:hypothetical protein
MSNRDSPRVHLVALRKAAGLQIRIVAALFGIARSSVPLLRLFCPGTISFRTCSWP